MFCLTSAHISHHMSPGIYGMFPLFSWFQFGAFSGLGSCGVCHPQKTIFIASWSDSQPISKNVEYTTHSINTTPMLPVMHIRIHYINYDIIGWGNSLHQLVAKPVPEQMMAYLWPSIKDFKNLKSKYHNILMLPKEMCLTVITVLVNSSVMYRASLLMYLSGKYAVYSVRSCCIPYFSTV